MSVYLIFIIYGFSCFFPGIRKYPAHRSSHLCCPALADWHELCGHHHGRPLRCARPCRCRHSRILMGTHNALCRRLPSCPARHVRPACGCQKARKICPSLASGHFSCALHECSAHIDPVSHFREPAPFGHR